MQKKGLDYNLIPAYLLINKHRSLSAAAKELKCTDSAVSKMLAKLREGFGDQLFVRTSSGLQPTAFTERLIPELEEKFTELEMLIDRASNNQLSTDTTVTISLLPIDVGLFGGLLYPQLKEMHPDVRFNIVSWNENVLDKVAAKEIDFAIGPTIDSTSKLCFQTPLFDSYFALIFPDKLSIPDWDTCISYRVLKPLLKGWNTDGEPVREKFRLYGIPVNTDELSEMDNIRYANELMVNNLDCEPCCIGLFSYQIERFRESINSEIQVVTPVDTGEYERQPTFSYSLYESTGNRDSHLYRSIRELIFEKVAHLPNIP